MSDLRHTSHYCRGGIECIDAIEASMQAPEFRGYLKGNVQKYLWRYDAKHGEDDIDGQIDDLLKARDYLDCLINRLQMRLEGR